MSFLFQILFVGLAVYTFARAPGGLLKWLAAIAALEFAFVLSFSTDVSAMFAVFAFGGGALVLFINAILTIQDSPDVLTLRLITFAFPLLIIMVLNDSYVMIYDGEFEQINILGHALPFVAFFTVIPLISGAIYILRCYLALVRPEFVFLIIAGVGIHIVFPDVLTFMPLLLLIYGYWIWPIIIMLRAKSKAGIRRAAVACYSLGTAAALMGLLEAETLGTVVLTLFGGAVALTCLAVIRHKAADAPANPHGSKHVYGTLGFSN